MDRAVLLAPGYPRAAFVDAFYHVVWSRRNAFVHPDGPEFIRFNDAIRVLFGGYLSPPCLTSQNGEECATCSTGRHTRNTGETAGRAMCEPRARQAIDTLFFSIPSWNGPLPAFAVRCHNIVTAQDKTSVYEAVFLPQQHTFDAENRGAHHVNTITYVFDAQSAKLERYLVTRNMTAFTAGLAIVCRAISSTPEQARQLYIDLRDALRTNIPRDDVVAELHAVVLQALLQGRGELEVADHMQHTIPTLTAFWDRHAGMHISPHDMRSLSALRPRKTARIQCALTSDHTLVQTKSQFGEYVEVTWSADAMSPLECRLTLQLWATHLGFVDAMHALVKHAPNGRHAIVLRRGDFMRLLQYAPARLHCARVVSLRMPVYKMLCQNYVHANMTKDERGAIAFVKDFMSLLASGIPDVATDSLHPDIGMLHALLALFGDTLALHTTRPYLDPQDLHVCVKETTTGGIDAMLTEAEAPTAFHNVADMASTVKGFAWYSKTIYGCMVAFLCIREPHVMARDAVQELCRLMSNRVADQPRYQVAMSVISEMWSRYSVPSVVINGVGYVDVPQEMSRASHCGTPPVAFVYGLLLSGLIERKTAANILLAIRLCPEKTPFLSMPSPLRLAETRTEGIAGLHALHRDYAGPPSGPFADLYSLPSVSELGCMQYFIFFLEMLTYVQGDLLHCDNLERCRRAYGRFGTRPHAPLQEDTFRGAVTPHHVIRYTRRDTTHDPTRTTYAYELEHGVFQNHVVPTVRLKEDCKNDDYSRLGPESPFAGADPFVLECIYMIPVDRVLVECAERTRKRKAAHDLDAQVVRSPGWKRFTERTEPSMSDTQWDREVRVVEMALAGRERF